MAEPTVVSTTPAANAQGVPTSTLAIYVTFSEDVYLNGTVWISQYGGSIDKTPTLSVDGDTLEIITSHLPMSADDLGFNVRLFAGAVKSVSDDTSSSLYLFDFSPRLRNGGKPVAVSRRMQIVLSE